MVYSVSQGLSDLVRILESLVKIPVYGVIGFTHGRVVYWSNVEGVLGLWCLDPVSGEVKRLTREPVHSVARPHPKSRFIAFTKDVAKGRELEKPFIISIHGGEEELLADTPPMRFFSMVWDGVKERLVFSAATPSGMGLYMAWRGGFERLMSINTIMYPTDIEGDLVVGAGLLRGNPLSMEIFTYDLGTGELRVYTPKEGSVNKEPMIRNGEILFESNFKGFNALYIYDLSTGELRSPEMSYRDYEEYGGVEHLAYGWVGDGRVWAVVKRDGRSRAFVDGREVPSPEGTIGYLAINEDCSKAYYSVSTLTTPHRIYEADLRSGSYRVVIDNPIPEELRGRLGRSYFTRYKSRDGLKIPMYVVESATAGKPGPTVVYVHGGPWSEIMDSWSVMINALSIAGYHVLAPNFRGSTGYGEEFRLMDIGDPGGGDLDDVAAAAEWGRGEGLASKIAIMGYSYGGYMTYLALGRRPDVWDAGVAGAGIVDWVEMYSLSDALYRKFIEVLFKGLNRELMVERSPIKYVDKVRAPLCIIHPQNDSRTPLKPVLRYVEELLKHGATFEVHVIPDMGHVVKTVEDVMRILLPAILFLNKYLKAQ